MLSFAVARFADLLEPAEQHSRWLWPEAPRIHEIRIGPGSGIDQGTTIDMAIQYPGGLVGWDAQAIEHLPPRCVVIQIAEV
jgi:hypothetical protein